MSSDSFRIKATPSNRVVSPGAVVTYWIDRDPGYWSGTMTGDWACVNDPQSTSWCQPNLIPGPAGTLAWHDAKWSFPGHHRIVCRVYDSASEDQFGTVTYEQEVQPLDAVLKAGPVLPLGPQDPAAYLDYVSRRIDVDLEEAKRSPPQGAIANRHNEQISRKQSFCNKLREKLQSSQGFVRYPVDATHFDIASQQWSRLHVFVVQTGPNDFVLVDWTNPAKKELTSEHRASSLAAVVDAWTHGGNRYPDGRLFIKVEVSGSPKIDAVYATTGTTFWDDVSKYLTWIALGAAGVAAGVMFLSPIPGPQVAAVAVWASIFTSTAAATINVVQRHHENFPDWKADAIDGLSIVSSMLGVVGAAGVWARGAPAIVPRTGSAALKGIFIGRAAADTAQGIVIADEYFEKYEAIQKDTSLTPGERNDQILRLIAAAAGNAALVYFNVKATKADLQNLDARPRGGGPTPREKLAALADPNHETIDLTKAPPAVEGHGAQGEHTTRVQVDHEQAPPHVGGQTARPAARVFPTPPPAKARGLRPGDDGAFRRLAQDKKWYILVRDSNSAAAERIGKPGFIPKPETVKAKTLKAGDPCKPENVGLAAANPNIPSFQRMLDKDHITYAEYKTNMNKAGIGIDESNDFLLFDNSTHSYYYSDADLHGLYDQGGNAVTYTAGIGDEVNNALGVNLIQHGPHDQWPKRNKPEAGDNRGPKPPVTAYLPDGSAQHLDGIADMKQFYLERGLPWDDVWNGQY